MLKVQYIQDKIISFLMLLGLLYAMVPFESSSVILTLVIHSMGLILIMGIALVMSNFKVSINKMGRIILMGLVFLILISYLISDDKRGLSFTLSILFSSITASIIVNNHKFNKYFVASLKWLIVLSISMLFIQIIFLNISGTVIRFHEMAFPFSEARISVNDAFSLTRTGGLNNEPGTHSHMMYIFLITYMVASNKVSYPIMIIGAISIILTISVWGMIFGTFLLFSLIFELSNKLSLNKRVFILVSLALMFFVSVSYVMESKEVSYALEKLDSDTASVYQKQKFYQLYSDTYDTFLLIGHGFSKSFGNQSMSTDDAGFILTLSIFFGILFAVIILIIYSVSILKRFSIIMFLASLPIFLGKYSVQEPIFWLLFFLVVCRGFSAIERKKNVKNSILA